MANEEHIVSYTADELEEMRARGEGRTNWERLRALTDEEIEASIDFEDEGEFDMSKAYVGLPPFITKQQLTVRIDKDVLDWFKAQGRGYQTRMNAVLRSYVEAEKQKARQTEHAASRQ